MTDSPLEAAEFIRGGGIVAFPTETVYGLGADVFDESAIVKIFEAKQRPPDNPLIVHISDRLQITMITNEVTGSAEKLIDTFFPGPLTVILRKRSEVPVIATAGLETVGIRMPANETARAFLVACRTPVAAPSANLSGRPSPTTWKAVFEDLDGRIDCILKGDAAEIGLESTVVDCTGDTPVLLRPGAISLEDLKRVVPTTSTIDIDNSLTDRSPGLRHRHYKPSAAVILVAPQETVPDDDCGAYIGLTERSETFAFSKICSSVEEYSHELFEFFRECDRRGISRIHCEMVDDKGIGQALIDRLMRAGN
jgi:L-threonylcarbamoyladenylate synthase